MAVIFFAAMLVLVVTSMVARVTGVFGAHHGCQFGLSL